MFFVTIWIIYSDSDVYQTQSQYQLLKQPITYSHKMEDKFDRIIKSTENTEINELSKFTVTKDDNSSILNSRSESPELFLNDFSDDSFMDSSL